MVIKYKQLANILYTRLKQPKGISKIFLVRFKLPESIKAYPIYLKVVVDQLAEYFKSPAAQVQQQVVVDLLLILKFAKTGGNPLALLSLNIWIKGT